LLQEPLLVVALHCFFIQRLMTGGGVPARRFRAVPQQVAGNAVEIGFAAPDRVESPGAEPNQPMEGLLQKVRRVLTRGAAREAP
jgi:hypothetical protein